MKNQYFITALIVVSYFTSSLSQELNILEIKEDLVTKYLLVFDDNDKSEMIKLSEDQLNILRIESDNRECIDGRFNYNVEDQPLRLPLEHRFALHHHLTEGKPGNGYFTIGCDGCRFRGCVDGKWNPRRFRPRETSSLWYGQCFAKAIGKARACKTSYGWRVEGDKDKNGDYEAIYKIVYQ